MKVLVLYYTMGGSTKRVADAICEGLAGEGTEITLKSVTEAENESYFDYALVRLGFPSIHWHVPAPVEKFLKGQFAAHGKAGLIVPGAPRIGKDVLLFCTYCGTHTGVREAVPAVKYAGQFFEHVGFSVVDEWYVVGEFKGNEPNNLHGRLGDVSGLPDERSIQQIRTAAVNLAARLREEEARRKA